VLKVRELTKRFGGFTALNAVSFEVQVGEILGLIGPNGSGKTTAFNCISGALPPSSGSITFDDREIGGLTPDAVCHLGVARTFQIPRPFRKLSIMENVAVAAHYGNRERTDEAEARRRARQILELVGLPTDPAASTTLLGAGGHAHAHRGPRGRARPRREDRRGSAARRGRGPARDRGVPRREDRAGMSLLELTSVTAGYGHFTALWDVALRVERGEAVAVVGPNGAGKTTLLRVISGILPVRAGTLTFDGAALAGRPAHEVVAHGIAHVPEGRRLFPALSVAENLKMGAYLPPARAHYRESLERVWALFPVLAERKAQRAGSLSGGEQQMLAIGRALMSRPRLILLDEPSMGLAPVMVLRLFELIRRIRAEGYTILVVEQNVRQVLKLVDRAYLLEVGRIKMEGRAAELAEQDFVRKAYVGL
jgi:branched-chain amino acid transport system ATP-binding protein